jgi:thymidylate synthase (FAD)
MHQDYSEKYTYFETSPPNHTAEIACVKRLLAGGRGHYGPYEHTHILFGVGYFPHSVMQQLRTHRVGISFDVQSLRYTGERIIDVARGAAEVEEVFYVRPVGSYQDRSGARYSATEVDRAADLQRCFEAACVYRDKVEAGWAYEHARSGLPFDYRQHFVLSLNARSLMHVLDLRLKADAQQEIRELCELIFERFKAWMPATADWYESDRLKKARLAP